MEDEIKTKVCGKCNAKLLATNEFFSSNKNTKDGLQYNCKVCNKQYGQDNKEKITERMKQYRTNNAEHINESRKRYRVNNSERIAERKKQYRAENAEQIAEGKKIYRENNRERFVLLRQYRRATKKSLLSDFTAEQWENCLSYFNNEDAYTGLPLNNPSQDHVIPLSKGGCYTMNNIVPCNHSINSSKGNKDMLIWFRKQTFYDVERENKILAYLGKSL